MLRNVNSALRCGAAVLVIVLLSACGGGSGPANGSSQESGETANLDPPTNTAPSIFGTPATVVIAGTSYAFTPAATDPDFDVLTYSIVNKPRWASFNSSSGALTGQPGDNDVGQTTGIMISVSDGLSNAALPAFNLTVAPADVAPPDGSQPPPTDNSPPTIGGTPAKAVAVGNGYAFTPTAADPDGDPLTFRIANKPAWASFTATTGRLYGKPATADVGIYADIVITVSDGQATAALPPFSITVNGVTTGSATLSWNAPTLNSDGTTLTDLAGYRVYYTRTLGDYSFAKRIDNPGITTYLLDNLSPGTWHFVVTAFDGSGNESEYSNAASKTILEQ